MEKLYRVTVLFFALILSSTILPKIINPLYIPDLFLLITVCFALLKGSGVGFWSGLGAGFLQDAFGGLSNILIKPFLGLICGRIEGKIFKNNYYLAFLVFLIFSFLNILLTLLLHEYLIFGLSWQPVFFKILLPRIIVETIVGGTLYIFILAFERRFFNLSLEF